MEPVRTARGSAVGGPGACPDSDFRPGQLVGELARAGHPVAVRKGLELTVDVCGDPQLRAEPAVQVRLRQVLAHLVDNALAHTVEGQVALLVESAPAERDLVALRLTVTDTGPGIALERLAELLRSGTTGLARSRRLTQELGGRLLATSSIGVGSAFTLEVELPLSVS